MINPPAGASSCVCPPVLPSHPLIIEGFDRIAHVLRDSDALVFTTIDVRFAPAGSQAQLVSHFSGVSPIHDQHGEITAQYSNGVALQRCLRTPNAARTCSTPVGGTPARGSGRRGRRFKSCHPDQCSRRSEALLGGWAFGLGGTATEYHNGAHRRDSGEVAFEWRAPLGP
jgi:hypothetical protein